MVRFPCFNGHTASPKPKKTAASLTEIGGPSTSQNQAKISTISKTTQSINRGAIGIMATEKDASLIERDWKSDDMMSRIGVGEKCGVFQSYRLKKSQSLESGLENKGKAHVDMMEDKSDGQFSAEIVVKSRLMTLEENAMLSINRGVIGIMATEKDASLIERDWKSDDMMSRIGVGEKCGVFQSYRLKKSQSLESGLENKGKAHVDMMEDKSDGQFSAEIVVKSRLLTLEENATSPPSAGGIPKKQPIFSIGDLHTSENGKHENYKADVPFYDIGGDSGDRTPRTPPMIMRPRSLPNICASSPVSYGFPREFRQRSRSSEDLLILGLKHKDTSNYELKMQLRPQEDGAYDDPNTGFHNDGDDDDSYPDARDPPGDKMVPAVDELLPKSLQEVGLPLDDSLGKDFKIKRIQKWVIDLQPCIPSEDVYESFELNDEAVADHAIVEGIEVKADVKVSPGMEPSKRYMSSLSASATACQLGNHGLEVIPFLSAFVSLKMVNLSGNNIARIITGALPRGLHVLNLSRNRISTIEGLRELSRLRVLDLSYNRIFRIGHGLASCSSLKQLYLAGNKISEVEGLHRLLKLNVLDLCLNKISTGKCLGQLAANYNSLQAISLEGNPAQKNIGDEQLKKHLQGLLPQLAYYNKQPMKVSTLKDSSERAVRLSSSSSYQFDRNLRLDAKSLKKGGQSVASKPLSSSHARRSQAAATSSKSKHGRLPPMGSRTTAHHQLQHYHFDFSEKLRSLKPDLSMRRSRSEGTLGVL